MIRRLCVLLVACKAADAPPVVPIAPSDAGVSIASAAPEPVAVAPDAGVALPAPLDVWNEAHTTHDLRALEAAYDDNVLFYGGALALREVIKRKDAAFHVAPDYRQSLHDVAVLPDGSGNFYVTFAKEWIANGKTTTAPGYVFVFQSRINAEGDRPSKEPAREWCLVSTPDNVPVPTDDVVPPFKTSVLAAVRKILASKTARHLTGYSHSAFVSVPACPKPACSGADCLLTFAIDVPLPTKALGSARRHLRIALGTLDLVKGILEINGDREQL